MLVMPKRGEFEQTHGHRLTPVKAPSSPFDAPPDAEIARLLVVERSDIRRAGMLAILEREEALEIVGVARSVDDAHDLAGSIRPAPDVVLVGSPPSGRLGGTVFRTIRSAVPDAALVALPTAIDAPTLAAFLASGARAVVRADRPAADIVAAVRLAAEGSTYLDRAASPLVPEVLRRGEASAHAEELTGREMAALALIGSGASNHQIARQLGVSHGTVKATIQSVLRKLGTENRTAAVTAALRSGILGLQPALPEPVEEAPVMFPPPRAAGIPTPEEPATSERAHVLVFRGESLMAEGVASLLNCSTDLTAEVVGEADTVTERMSAAPGALVIAGQAAQASALLVLQAAAGRRVPAIVVGSYDPGDMDALGRAGITAHLGDDVSAAALLDAVRLAIRRDVPSLPDQPPGITWTEADLIAGLPHSERTLLALLARGLSNAAIAEELGTSVPAVKGLCARLFHELGIRNRAEAAAIAVRHGIGL